MNWKSYLPEKLIILKIKKLKKKNHSIDECAGVESRYKNAWEWQWHANQVH